MVEITKVKKGDLMAVVTFVKVDETNRKWSTDRTDQINVSDVDGKWGQFQVVGGTLIENMLSADHYEEVKKVTKTELATILSNSYNTPFTVVFKKKTGETRLLRGRLLQPEPLMGRCHVEDLDITSGSRLRLVDNRELETLIVKGVKYEAK